MAEKEGREMRKLRGTVAEGGCKAGVCPCIRRTDTTSEKKIFNFLYHELQLKMAFWRLCDTFKQELSGLF